MLYHKSEDSLTHRNRCAICYYYKYVAARLSFQKIFLWKCERTFKLKELFSGNALNDDTLNFEKRLKLSLIFPFSFNKMFKKIFNLRLFYHLKSCCLSQLFVFNVFTCSTNIVFVDFHFSSKFIPHHPRITLPLTYFLLVLSRSRDPRAVLPMYLVLRCD